MRALLAPLLLIAVACSNQDNVSDITGRNALKGYVIFSQCSGFWFVDKSTFDNCFDYPNFIKKYSGIYIGLGDNYELLCQHKKRFISYTKKSNTNLAVSHFNIMPAVIEIEVAGKHSSEFPLSKQTFVSDNFNIYLQAANSNYYICHSITPIE